MSDEQRRRLEREARYDDKLAAFLMCLREGHAALEGTVLTAVHVASERRDVNVRLCSRCGLAWWEARVLVGEGNTRRCECGHSFENHYRDMAESLVPGAPVSCVCPCPAWRPVAVLGACTTYCTRETHYPRWVESESSPRTATAEDMVEHAREFSHRPGDRTYLGDTRRAVCQDDGGCAHGPLDESCGRHPRSDARVRMTIGRGNVPLYTCAYLRCDTRTAGPLCRRCGTRVPV